MGCDFLPCVRGDLDLPCESGHKRTMSTLASKIPRPEDLILSNDEKIEIILKNNLPFLKPGGLIFFTDVKMDDSGWEKFSRLFKDQGWTVKHDPCRGAGQTRVEIRPIEAGAGDA